MITLSIWIREGVKRVATFYQSFAKTGTQCHKWLSKRVNTNTLSKQDQQEPEWQEKNYIYQVASEIFTFEFHPFVFECTKQTWNFYFDENLQKTS